MKRQGPLLGFLRYDAPLDAAWVGELAPGGLDERRIEALARMGDPHNIEMLYDLGLKAGERLVQADHFASAFDPV